MTAEERQLLYKDLCARMPYGVKVHISSESEYCLHEKTITLDIDNLHKFILDGGYYVHGLLYKTPNFQLLPYLRPMSSMTEEEEDEYQGCGHKDIAEAYIHVTPQNRIDYLLSHHFDFRGLIPMGLALEAPEDMYEKGGNK